MDQPTAAPTSPTAMLDAEPTGAAGPSAYHDSRRVEQVPVRALILVVFLVVVWAIALAIFITPVAGIIPLVAGGFIVYVIQRRKPAQATVSEPVQETSSGRPQGSEPEVGPD